MIIKPEDKKIAQIIPAHTPPNTPTHTPNMPPMMGPIIVPINAPSMKLLTKPNEQPTKVNINPPRTATNGAIMHEIGGGIIMQVIIGRNIIPNSHPENAPKIRLTNAQLIEHSINNSIKPIMVPIISPAAENKIQPTIGMTTNINKTIITQTAKGTAPIKNIIAAYNSP